MRLTLLSLALTAIGFFANVGCSKKKSSVDPSIDIARMSFEEYATWRSLVAFAAAGGDVNRSGSDGSTPLTLALRRRHAQTVRWLLDHGADVNSMAGLMTPLQVAVTNDDLEIAALLLSRGARVDPVGLRERIEQAKEEFRKRINDNAPEGVTVSEQLLWPDVPRLHPMQTALERNHVEMVRLFLKHGGKIRLEGYVYGFPPLHDAIKKSRTELAKLLMESGQDVNEKSDPFFNEATPLHVAALQGNLELARLLVEKGADLNTRTKDGLTPLVVALGGRTEPFGQESDPPPPRKTPDAAHQAVAAFLRGRGAKE